MLYPTGKDSPGQSIQKLAVKLSFKNPFANLALEGMLDWAASNSTIETPAMLQPVRRML